MKKTFWNNKKVLITGAEGFIGSHFFNIFQDNNIRVVGTLLKTSHISVKSNLKKGKIISLNVLDKKKLRVICKLEKINLIIHCAALDGNAEFKKNNTTRIMDENIKMVSNILNVAQELDIKEVVIMSSADIYSSNAKSPTREEDDYTKYFPEIDNGYVAAKISAEILAKLYSKQFGLKIMLPRPTNVYGLGDKTDIKSIRVIPEMIKKILLGETIKIWGDGNQLRSFIYISDFINSIISMIELRKFSILNIATKESISIKNLAKLIAKISHKKLNVAFDKTKYPGAKKRVLDVKKLYSIIDFKPIKLETGLKIIIDAYRKKYL